MISLKMNRLDLFLFKLDCSQIMSMSKKWEDGGKTLTFTQRAGEGIQKKADIIYWMNINFFIQFNRLVSQPEKLLKIPVEFS